MTVVNSALPLRVENCSKSVTVHVPNLLTPDVRKWSAVSKES